MPVIGSTSVEYLERQRLNRSWKDLADKTSFRSLSETEQIFSGSKNHGKSVSLAIQAKINVQRRQKFSPSSCGYLESRKDRSNAMPNQNLTSQQKIQKSLPKLPAKNHAEFLFKNNQNQKCLTDKHKSSKSAGSNSQSSKDLSGNSCERQKLSGKSKTAGSKNGIGKLGSDKTNREKGISRCSTKKIPRKKTNQVAGGYHKGRNVLLPDKSGRSHYSDALSPNPKVPRAKHLFQGFASGRTFEIINHMKEISAWRSMENELVDKHMCRKNRRRVDFNVFVLGTEIEGHIYDTLLDEEVASFIHCLVN